MDSGELDRNGKCVEELFSEKLVPLNSPDTSDIFGDQQVHPRVGDKYQVKIPCMITESERLHLLRNPDDTEINFNVSHYFVLGLAVPAMWIDDKINNNRNEGIKVYKKRDDSVNAKGSVGSKKVKKRQHISNKKGLKAKTLDVALDSGKESKSAISKPAMAGKANPNQMCRSKSCCLVPGLLGDSSWTDIEFSSFLLALYIFEKNLVQVKRFMESKEMGEILSFYYGKFYGSDEHRRYADCRKMMKSRKCKIGQRIFTGWRQQELLSRLLLHVSEDAKSTLVEVSKAFAEGRTSLEEYVHTLKTVAGIPVLIEAVGIGRGKEDLTNLAMEPTKTNLVFPFRPKIPVGKACSSLAFEDIVKFLTGDFRLSKAQLNDIFWEAVWPRLLERGWHSEQPKNHGYYSSKHQLVFLMPGVKKFSRRKLVKGDHYLDSVRDVLSRVASEPKLIKLEDEEPRVSSCEEVHERESEEPTINHDDPADHQQHYYLKPRVSTYNPNLLRLTVVDTSLVCGEKSSKVRELKNLPSDTGITYILSNHSKESDGDSSGDSVDEPDSVVMLLKGQKKPRSSNHSKGMVDNSNSNQRMPIDDSKAVKKLVGNHHYQGTGLSNAKQLRTIKNCFSRRVRPGRSNLLPPLTKRRTLAACAKDDTSCSMEKFMVGSGFTQVEPSFRSNSLDVSKVGPFDEKKVLSTSSSLEGSPKKDSNKGILHENMYGMEISLAECEKPQSRPLIDLNVLQDPSDSENGEICDTKVDESQKSHANVLCFSSDKYELVKEPNNLCTSSNVNAAEKHPIGSPRRQSTRNRPLTTRALEALAFGYLSTKRRRKGTENQRQYNPVSKHSCKAHIIADVTSNSGSISSVILDDKDQNGVDGVCKGSKSTVSNSLSETERKVALELVEISKATYHPGVLNFNDD